MGGTIIILRYRHLIAGTGADGAVEGVIALIQGKGNVLPDLNGLIVVIGQGNGALVGDSVHRLLQGGVANLTHLGGGAVGQGEGEGAEPWGVVKVCLPVRLS